MGSTVVVLETRQPYARSQILRVCSQVWFYAWGFDSLAHDDTLELSLAGRSSINSLSLPTTEIAAPESTADLLAQGQCVAGNTRRQVTATDCGGSTANGFRGGGCWKACKLRVWDIFVSPNIIAVACGLVIAVVPPVQEMLFVNPRAFLRPLGAAFQVGCLLPISIAMKIKQDVNRAGTEWA